MEKGKYKISSKAIKELSEQILGEYQFLSNPQASVDIFNEDTTISIKTSVYKEFLKRNSLVEMSLEIQTSLHEQIYNFTNIDSTINVSITTLKNKKS